MSGIKEISRSSLDGLKLKKAQKQDLNQLLDECREFIGDVDEKQIEKAFKLCYLSHDGMTRASGEPYYYHPVEVAKIVAREINIDEISVIAALLHDTVEDTSVTLSDIEYWFGKEVAVIINGVTKIEGVFKSRQKLL